MYTFCKQFLLIGLFSVALAGCNLLPPLGNIGSTNSSSLPSAETVDSNPVLEEMCYTAKKNEAKAKKLYRGKVVSARGRLSISENYGDGYHGYVHITTRDFHISLNMSSKKNLEDYEEGQIVDSGNVKVWAVSVDNPIGGEFGTGKYLCFVNGE